MAGKDHCYRHGCDYPYGRTCPECAREEDLEDRQSLQDAIEQIRDELSDSRIDADDLADKLNNPGDYCCPECQFRTLIYLASRCFKCQASISHDFWEAIDRREEERRRKREQAAAEAKAKAEREEAEAQERARLAKAEDARQKGYLLLFFLLCAFVVLIIIWSGALEPSKQQKSRTESPANNAPVAASPPEQIIDRGGCPYEGCRYDERWMAIRDIDLYVSHPDKIGIGESGLQKQATVTAREWVRTVTGVVLAGRHDGIVNLEKRRTSFGTAVVDGPPLRHGQVVPLYSYLGEGCWTCWIDGRLLDICGTEVTGDHQVQHEWWVQVRTADGSLGWTNTAAKAFVSEESLNSELGNKILDSTLTLSEKLSQVSELIKGGADLNGSAGNHGLAPLEAAIRMKDVDLMRSLQSIGLELHGGPSCECPASIAAYAALEPGGDSMLEFLLESGMDLSCLQEPPLTAFLRRGIATENYPLDRAIRIAAILIRNGATINQRDSEGRSVLDSLDQNLQPNARKHVLLLREALLKTSFTDAK